MQNCFRFNNKSQRLLSRDAPEHATEESPDTRRARGDVNMEPTDVGPVARGNPMDDGDRRIMKLVSPDSDILEAFFARTSDQ